ncbi:MAG: purine-nucleoside phosphorylase [Acidobacteria bacterium]|nr:purine-nucleoside phosphorylase [Acidobacteriota bacterium]MCB9397010.1 purine-nucleoside phosphorylase [Acidobacteriota bacterium]
MKRIEEAKAFIQARTDHFDPACAVILGSGLGNFANSIQVDYVLPYSEIPHFKPCNVAGHAGNLVFGRVGSVRVVCQQGRFHFYEGHAREDLIFPVRVMAALGAKALVVTNAAGGINSSFKVGDMMVIRDHINHMGTNPLIGENEDALGPRFQDMTYAYPENLRTLLYAEAKKLEITLKEGVYLAVTGPCYETPAEIRMYRLWGADAVGMSTVPEVIAANHCGLKVLGISCITNAAAGMEDKPLDHKEVQEVTARLAQQFEKLVHHWIQAWAKTSN